MAKEFDRAKLEYWQGKLADSETAYEKELQKMDVREKIYRGADFVLPMVEGDKTNFTPYVRNICAEIIESQIDSTIPYPKVTPMRPEDEEKARLIEDMLRSEIDRMPSEQLNDMSERTVRIQGGALKLCEWDESERSETRNGEIVMSVLHPKQVIPQDGVFSDIEDMDYIFIKMPQTKGYIKRRYGIDVELESESDPEVRSTEGDTSDDMVTQCIAYFRNDKGGIGRYSWVCDTPIEDIEDYQARVTSKCSECGAPEPEDEPESISSDVLIMDDGEPARKKKICPVCGGTHFKRSEDEYEEIFLPITLTDGNVIEGEHPVPHVSGGEGEELSVSMEMVPTRVPYYKPNIYPIILQKNVSLFGHFLGDSDVDKLAPYQNAIKRLDAKIIEKLLESGSVVTLPPDTNIETGNRQMRSVRISRPEYLNYFGVHNLEGSISQDLAYRDRIYEEAKQAIGVTDSYLGRIDRTATSGKAKEFSAAQAAGRMESKRVMKSAAWSRLYEAIFKFKLSCDDDRRPVASRDARGDREFRIFNRYDFLEKDEGGNYYWNDMFLFSCDETSALSSNREAMWQETRANLQSGAFGNPTEIDTLILFWTKMEQLHYPGASDTKRYLEEKLEKSIIAQAQMDAQAHLDAQKAEAMAVIGQAERDAAVALGAGR